MVGQEHVTRSLGNALARDSVGHAYLFAGTRGIGKTSVARIFARALRCEGRGEGADPCGECRGCEEAGAGDSMNVLEIDGASNNSVDHVRDLVGKIQTLPTFGPRKVYIIDEVHMLSTSAFNALLKTLEDPPGHVVFVMATTMPEKLPSTVLSRCLRFDFRRASVEVLAGHLRGVAGEEGIRFASDRELEAVCVQAEGSFRDALSLLDQALCLSGGGVLDEGTVAAALGLAKASGVRDLAGRLLAGDAPGAGGVFRGSCGRTPSWRTSAGTCSGSSTTP